MISEYTFTSDAFEVGPDLNLKEIVHDWLYGSPEEKPRGEWVVLQRVRRNANGPIVSKYTHKNTSEGRSSHRGPATTRTGYICDEALIRVFHRPPQRLTIDEGIREAGNSAPQRDVVFFSFKDKPRMHDVIVFVEKNDDGTIKSPVTPLYEMNITLVYPRVLDNDEVQFYACVVERQK